MKKRIIFLILLCLSFGLSACSTSSETVPDETAQPVTLPPETTVPTTAPTEATEAILRNNIDGMVCVGVVSTEHGRRYGVIPDQEAADAAFRKAMTAAVSGQGWQGDLDLGIHVDYQGEYLYLTGSGALVGFDMRIPAEAAADLYALAMETALATGWQEPVTPEQLQGITSARLNWYNPVTLTDPEKLSALEAILSRSGYLYGGAGCPFGNLLTLELANGETVTISMAADSCGAWMSNGVYYDFGSGNEDFYSLFAPEVIHALAPNGIDALEELRIYLNWADYANLYGPEETMALMDAFRNWAMEDPSPDRLSAMMHLTTGLDGACTEYYGSILKQLYETNPGDFAWACLGNAPDSVKNSVLNLLAGTMAVTPAEVEALLRSNIPT